MQTSNSESGNRGNTPSPDTELNRAAIDTLEHWHDAGDIEAAHIAADDVLCDLLESLGYSDVIAAYHKVPKWFA